METLVDARRYVEADLKKFGPLVKRAGLPNSALAVKIDPEEFAAMDVTRRGLAEHFQHLSDDELLAEFRHGDLTELAKGVAAKELGRREIDPLQIPSESPADEQATSISGDLVLVARYFTAAEAHILRSRLELEGVPATVTDDNMAQALGWLTVGGVRVLVSESNIQRAREIVRAIERGDYTLGNWWVASRD